MLYKVAKEALVRQDASQSMTRQLNKNILHSFIKDKACEIQARGPTTTYLVFTLLPPLSIDLQPYFHISQLSPCFHLLSI